MNKQVRRRDYTAMLHSLAERHSDESLEIKAKAEEPELTLSGEEVVNKLPTKVWRLMCEDLSPSDNANLAMSCKAFKKLLGSDVWDALKLIENHQHKIKFLANMDQNLPNHLLCFLCATYHIRTQNGKESLKTNNVLKPPLHLP